VGNDPISIEIHLSGDIARLMVGDEVAATFHHVPDLVFTHHAITVVIHLAEGLIWVKVWVP